MIFTLLSGKNRRFPAGNSGQVMILTILALGGAILGATTIAGLFMLYQIRQATDLANSGKAIYAADAGIEWALYNWFCDPAVKTPCPAPDQGTWNSQTLRLGNNASAKLAEYCFDSNGALIGSFDSSGSHGNGCSPISNASSTTFKSVGTSGNSSRALGFSF